MERVIEALRLIGGEADSVRLFKQGKFDAIATDDQRFLDVLDGLGVPAITPAALLLRLVKNIRLSQTSARQALDKLKAFISYEEYTATLHEVERLKG